jgi:hypothetical protein
VCAWTASHKVKQTHAWYAICHCKHYIYFIVLLTQLGSVGCSEASWDPCAMISVGLRQWLDAVLNNCNMRLAHSNNFNSSNSVHVVTERCTLNWDEIFKAKEARLCTVCWAKGSVWWRYGLCLGVCCSPNSTDKNKCYRLRGHRKVSLLEKRNTNKTTKTQLKWVISKQFWKFADVPKIYNYTVKLCCHVWTDGSPMTIRLYMLLKELKSLWRTELWVIQGDILSFSAWSVLKNFSPLDLFCKDRSLLVIWLYLHASPYITRLTLYLQLRPRYCCKVLMKMI